MNEFKLKPIHPVATILNNLRLIALVAGLGTLLLGTLILLRVKPIYLSEAAFEVTLLHSRLLVWDQEKQFSSRTQYTDYVSTQVNYIVSYETVTEALGTLDLSRTPLVPGANETETYLRFIRMIKVQPVNNTHLISVAMEHSEPQGLSLLVNALVDTYFARTAAYEMSRNDSSINHLREELKREREELAEKQERLTNYSLDLGTLNLTREMNPHDESLSYLRQALNQAIVERVIAENSLNALERSIGAIENLGVEPMVEEFVNQDLNTIEMKNRTFEITEELNRQSSSLTTAHPNRRRLQEDAARSQQYLENQLAESRAKAARIMTGKLNLEQKRALIEKRALYETSVKNEIDVRARYEQEMSALKQAIPNFLNARSLNGEIDNAQERISQIETRLEELGVEALEPGRLRIQSRARDPLYPIKDRRKLFLVMAGLFCLTIGVAAAFARDYLEPSVIDPQHMSSILGTRPTGVLPHWEGGDFGQLMRHSPDSYHGDLFRRFMPRIFTLPTNAADPQVYTVLSLVHGHGATSVALNCLTHLEQMGRSAGLLDLSGGDGGLLKRIADWGLERLDPAASQPRSESFPLVVFRAASGMECYHLEQPYAGSIFADAAQLKRQLKALAARTGCLLVDVPPLFQDAEAEIYCRLADVVVLVVNGPKLSASALARGVAQLQEIGVAKCAVIANDLPILPGGYFSRDRAAFAGEDLKYPLVRDAVTAVKQALDPRNRRI